MIKIDKIEKCDGCGSCTDNCPAEILKVVNDPQKKWIMLPFT